MSPELLQALQQLPLESLAVGFIGGGVGGYFWQQVHGVAQFAKDEQGVYQDIRPSLRAEKTVNAIQGALAGVAVALCVDTFWQGSWDAAIRTAAGVSLPYLLKMALDTDRLPAGMKRMKKK